jgi:predicted HAD superfamily Cof-like phosphohydrolase
MTIYEEKLKECHKAMECSINEHLSVDVLKLRYKLLNEELEELKTEIDTLCHELETTGTTQIDTRSRMLKELSDLQYVLSGMAISFNLPLEEAFTRVHTSNMSKLVDGKPLKRADGKFLKGPNYHPPYLDDLSNTFE